MPAPPRRARRRPRAAVPWALAAGAAVAWLGLRTVPVAWIDGAWAQGWLPIASRAGAPLLALSPASLSALSALVLVGLAGIAVARRPPPGWWLAVAAAVLVGAAATFELAWGVAYRRTPLESRLELAERAPNGIDWWRAADLALAVAHDAAPDDATTLDADAPWPADAWAAAAACVADADAIVTGRAQPLEVAAVVRRLPPGTLLAAGFGGFVGPWWREPHVDGGLPPAAARAIALHELVHATGWAREAETDALAVLAGMGCADDAVRFAASAHALALLRAEIGRLARGPLEGAPGSATAAYLEVLAAAPPAVARAAAAQREAAARYAIPWLGTAAGAGYDAYLRVQGVEAGLADYGRAGTLVVAALAACARGELAAPCPRAPAPP